MLLLEIRYNLGRYTSSNPGIDCDTIDYYLLCCCLAKPDSKLPMCFWTTQIVSMFYCPVKFRLLDSLGTVYEGLAKLDISALPYVGSEDHSGTKERYTRKNE
jgi:hypothetical protein